MRQLSLHPFRVPRTVHQVHGGKSKGKSDDTRTKTQSFVRDSSVRRSGDGRNAVQFAARKGGRPRRQLRFQNRAGIRDRAGAFKSGGKEPAVGGIGKLYRERAGRLRWLPQRRTSY